MTELALKAPASADWKEFGAIWREEVREGLRDPYARTWIAADRPKSSPIRAAVSGSRVRGGVELSVQRGDHGRVITADLVVGHDRDAALELLRWAIAQALTRGAVAVRTWILEGRELDLSELNFRDARPIWRMDRPNMDRIIEAEPPHGYSLRTLTDGPPSASAWVRVQQKAFGREWIGHGPGLRDWNHRISGAGVDPNLYLLALGSSGDPAAFVFCSIDTESFDDRPEPLGHVDTVGTVLAHRRHGLARWLTTEGLHRLRRAGAQSATVYVDGRNQNSANDLYGQLGFVHKITYHVWESPIERRHDGQATRASRELTSA